jgi:hypothetical protein
LQAVSWNMAKKYKKELQFKTHWYNWNPRYWFQRALVRPEGVRDLPEMLRLEVGKGVKPNKKPPVRIFLGTEAGQYRAERVFVWSVINTRDPARVYEIYFMKDLKGFDRTGWKTGFTNYRYGIPSMGGGVGRAIYNDVDQIYLADPGKLFDLDMANAGMMCITERETSVMLIDCEKMFMVWTLKDAQGGRTHSFFRDVVHERGLWRKLPGEWNARDVEFSPDKSKCFHFTTLQTQPWQPFPDVLRYAPHPDGEVWFALERTADKAGFNIFTKELPSRRFGEMLLQYKILNEVRGNDVKTRGLADDRPLGIHADEIRQLISETGAKSLLDYGAGQAEGYQPAPGEMENSRKKVLTTWPGVSVTCYDHSIAEHATQAARKFDGVISVGALQHIPEEDVPWVLDEMFKAAGAFVYAVVSSAGTGQTLPNGQPAPCNVQSPAWWKLQFEGAARRHPGARWRVRVTEKQSTTRGAIIFEGNGALAKAA